MLRVCTPIFVSGKDVVLESGFCVFKGIADLEAIGVYAGAMIKKQHYWPKGVPGGFIGNHLEDKHSGDVGIIKAITQDNKTFRILCMNELYCVMKIMVI